jgi:hypothetical protein
MPVRKAIGGSDVTPARRHEEIVVVARDRVVSGGFLTDPVGFLQAMGQLVKMSVSPDTIVKFAEAASKGTRDHVYRQVIQPPLVDSAAGDPRGAIQVRDLVGIHKRGIAAFPPAGTLPVGAATIPPDDGGTTTSKLPAVNRYVPPPTPEPKPTAVPSETPAPLDTPIPSETPMPSSTPTAAPTITPKPGGGPAPIPTAPAATAPAPCVTLRLPERGFD